MAAPQLYATPVGRTRQSFGRSSAIPDSRDLPARPRRLSEPATAPIAQVPAAGPAVAPATATQRALAETDFEIPAYIRRNHA